MREVTSHQKGVIWLPPLSPTAFDWPPPARFGENIEFLGCDRIGPYIATIWKANAPITADYTLYVHFVERNDPSSLLAQADHLLGHTREAVFRPSSQWRHGEIIVDLTRLPHEVQEKQDFQTFIGVWIPETQFRLQPQTEQLHIDQYGRLEICSKEALPTELSSVPQWQTFRQLIQEPQIVLIAPFDWSTVTLHQLAQFGNHLEFLGCDVAITRTQSKTHIWQVTIWRLTTPVEEDYSLRIYFTDRDGKTYYEEHLLGQQFLDDIKPTSNWEAHQIVLDVTLLPEGMDVQDVRVQVRSQENGQIIPPRSELLRTTPEGWVSICQ